MSTAESGRLAEERAVAHLRGLGYRILARNFRCRFGELDIVAEHDGCLVFVEVRSRASAAFGDALDAVGSAKRRQVARVARHYLEAARPALEDVRFDVVGITGDDLDHVVDAFTVDFAD